MSAPDAVSTPDFIELTAEIVSAYVVKNSVPAGDLADLIGSVHAAVAALASPQPEPEPERAAPAVSIKKSITPEYLISLEDGKPYKSLTRHLKGRGMTAQQYRDKWGLPRDYPMTSPNYSQRRSELAKSLGLGQFRRKGRTEPNAGASEADAPKRKPGRRARQAG
jgi:predicted transcriptional regulator